MGQYTVILEDVERVSMAGGSVRPRVFINVTNRRGVLIDAASLDDAWNQAKATYYSELPPADQPQTQIMDIKPGDVEVPPLPVMMKPTEKTHAGKSTGDT